MLYLFVFLVILNPLVVSDNARQGSISHENITIPMALSQSKTREPQEHVHYRQMLEEAKLLALGEMLAQAFFERVDTTTSSQSSGPDFKITGIFICYGSFCLVIHLYTVFCYNVEYMFVGAIPEGGAIPKSTDGRGILHNASFLATKLLPHNPARGDASLIHIAGNDPSTTTYDNTSLAQTLNAFSHFVFVYTGGHHLLVDYQGLCLLW